MNASLSLPPVDDPDTQMLKLAREIAIDILPIDKILTNLGISAYEFDKIRNHPRFISYLKTEREEWSSALNTHERTKIKAATIMEEFMLEAHNSLIDRKLPLNHRVELGKLVAKVAGMGEAKINGAEGAKFSLQINIGATPADNVNIRPSVTKIINHDEDEYNPLVSPVTIED